MLTTCLIKLIKKNKFIEAILDENVKSFMPYINSLAAKISINLAKKGKIYLLLIEKITIPPDYSDFADVFFEKVSKSVISIDRIK